MTAWVQRRSFQGRLTATIALAVGVTVALAAVASYFAVSRQLNKQVDQHLETYGSQILSADQSGYGLYGSGPVLRVASQEGTIVELVAPGSPAINVLSNTIENNTQASPISPTSAQRAIASEPAGSTRLDTASHSGTRYRVLTISLPAERSNAGVEGALLIYSPLTPTLNTLITLRLILYVLLIAGIAIALILGLVISRLTLRPVKRLTMAAEHVAATQQLDAVIEVDSADELGRLAYSFNEMLAALGASRRQQAQLVSDAGHELRTPLTSLRTNVELMMRAKKLPEADQRELYGDINAQVEELTTLIGDLVELARQDEQQAEPVEVRLDTIVEHSVQRAQRRAPSVYFDVDLTAGSVRAQPPLLERAVLNVLDNAAKWSPPNGTVTVRLHRGDTWILDVHDDGPGIAAEDLPRIFDRFYRAAAARSMPGSGLGLAIVQQVVATHGGRVSIESPPGGGTSVRIELPTVAEQEPTVGETPLMAVSPQPPPPQPGPRSDGTVTGGDGPLAPAGLSGPGSDRATP